MTVYVIGPAELPAESLTEAWNVTELAEVGVPLMVRVPPVLAEVRPSERPVTVKV